ncbi:putative Histidine kinase [metagenome]|uniref:histidine kinase n=1 Tax=metagenome TaxID=256318 RepID=A0A2P2C5D3_9ZZZZ
MTQDAARTRREAGLSVAGWPLSRKIALALAIPLLLAATLGGLRVQNDLADSRNAGRSADQVTIIQPAVDYLTASESAMVAAQSDSAASQGDLIDAIDDITTSAETLTQARDDANLDELQAAHVNALLDLSQAMRGEGAENLGPATWIALVRQLESSVSQLITSVNAAQETPEPRLEQLSQAMSGRLSLAMQQGFVATALAQSSSQELFSEIGVEAAAIDRLAGSVEGADEQTAALRTANTRHAGQIRDDSATNLDGRDAYAPYDEITQNLISGVTSSLNEAASDARRNALVGAALTLLALGAAIFIAFAIARSLLVPINRVREGALAVARHRLPDAVARIRAGQEPEPIKPIDVDTNEEVGQLARAVDDLHRQAIHLASGEAQLRQTVNAMFVTLSRRSNSLVNQQLAQIERLEHDEEDPKRLESLFRLDHLASRMRRTADSLLILADAPNRAAGQFSLTVGEALQAATSGVQDYQRVQILSHLGTRVGDDAAADVVHLLTELVDNALTYSPPAEPVRLAAKLGSDGVTITITDSGLGVPPAELEQLNRDLQHGSEATPDTARRMGLFVVSRLAERHGILASLARNPGGGMTATIVLPPSILPELPQTTPATPVAAPAAAVEASPAARTERREAPAAAAASAAPVEPKRESRKLSRAEKAEAKAAEKAAQAEARAARREARKEAELEPLPVATTPAVAEPAVTPDRPSLESLLPRREPGANMPRTGADAFLPPETSGATGPLFGKRSEAPAAPVEPSAPAAEPAATLEAPAAEAAPEVTETAPVDTAEAPVAEKVAPVVPITALASRQRAQAEEARAAEVAPAPRAQDPLSDPLSDPLPTRTFGEQARAEEPVEEQAPADVEVAEPVAEPVAHTEPEPQPQAPVAHRSDDVEVDVDDPLGLGAPARRPEPAAEPTVEPAAEAFPVEDPFVEEPVAATPVTEPEPAGEAFPVRDPFAQEPVAEPVAETPLEAPAAELPSLSGLPTRGAEPARAGGDSPIFKSMRSGWLASAGEGEWHQTEVDRGWEIAEHVAEEAPVVESTPTGLPRRAPGERLVPGSVTPPTAAKTRDPDAIRRRLQAHTAGVSRGRRAAQSSSQHTEAGPA